MKKITLCLSIVFFWFIANQSQAQPDDYLEHYIELGLRNNLTINQKQLEVEKSFQDVRNSKGSLLPSG